MFDHFISTTETALAATCWRTEKPTGKIICLIEDLLTVNNAESQAKGSVSNQKQETGLTSRGETCGLIQKKKLLTVPEQGVGASCCYFKMAPLLSVWKGVNVAGIG